MRLFGYYALHTFVNQLRKLFKTWVIVFILVCGLMGGLIGYGAATLEDMAEAEKTPETIEEILEEAEEESELPISPAALTELIAGGVLLALFAFEAVSADTNGSKIFLPADVNLLFASPMKPQSVLMFRLAAQMGQAILLTIYLMFQLPNLILNLGMSPWVAIALLAAWFGAILTGRLIRVLIYTVCSTWPRVKKYMRRCIYALLLLIGSGYLGYFKTSGLGMLEAADRFFNAPATRYIPFWGWLKAVPGYAAEGNLTAAIISTVLTALGGVVMVYFIWNIKADFYEDAMAKSEQTAALMEAARAEKSSGVTAVKQRTKERSSKLKRDGIRHGWGASVFFHRTMYNRFRFAHLGFFTKTMETYLFAAVGTAMLQKFVMDSASPLPAVLVLGAFVFFRAMGNPLEEDTAMDFFRLIPEPAWQKMLYSALGGIVNTLLDLILPMLAASAVLMVNPLRLLVWLPVIITVDFYASSVASFIDLSVPISAGKTIKTLIQVMFIYFGLLPDIAVLAVGIIQGWTVTAALIASGINLFLGLLFFLLAASFIEPGGRAYTAGVHQDLKAAKKSFSRLGFGVLVIFVATTLLQLVMSNVVLRYFPGLWESQWGLWLVTFVPQYVVGMPLGWLILRKVTPVPPEKKKLGLVPAVLFGFVCIAMMYGGNLVGALVTSIIGTLRQSQVTNPLMEYIDSGSTWLQVLFMVILAPMLEEFIFRKQLIDRMRIYGGKTAVVLSALLFGLFHGNLSQFFYAFFLGLAFGYVYLNTGKIRITITAHMIINFFGSIFSVWLLNHLPESFLEGGEVTGVSGWVIAYGGYVTLMIVGSILGGVILVLIRNKLTWPAGDLELPRNKRFSVTCCNWGMALVMTALVGMTVVSLFL